MKYKVLIAVDPDYKPFESPAMPDRLSEIPLPTQLDETKKQRGVFVKKGQVAPLYTLMKSKRWKHGLVRGEYYLEYLLKKKFKDQKNVQIDFIYRDAAVKQYSKYDLCIFNFIDFSSGCQNNADFCKFWLTNRSKRVVPSLEIRKMFMDKGNFYKFLKKHGIPIAKTTIINFSPTEAEITAKRIEKIFKAWNNQAMVCKPVWGSGSEGFVIIKQVDQILPYAKKLVQDSARKEFWVAKTGLVVQEFIESFYTGIEYRNFFFNGHYKYTFDTRVFGNDLFNLGNRDVSSKQPWVILAKKTIKKICKEYDIDNLLVVRVDISCCVNNGQFFVNELECFFPNLFINEHDYEWALQSLEILTQACSTLIRKKIKNLR